MKNLVLVAILSLITSVVFSQDRVVGDNFNSIHFLYFQPSARAEAMGQGFVAIDNDLSAYYFNPAGLSTLSGLNFSSNYGTTTNYFEDGLSQKFFSIGLPINNLGVFSVSYIQSGIKNDLEITSVGQPEGTGEYVTAQDYQFVLSYAKHVFKGIHVGLNLNYFKSVLFKSKGSTAFLDFGAMYHKTFLNSSEIKNKIIIGLSITNVTNSKYSLSSQFDNSDGRIPGVIQTSKMLIPQTIRIGGSYLVQLTKNSKEINDTYLRYLITTEYRTVLNSDWYDSFHFGNEFTVLNFLDIRVGYYSNKKQEKEAFTYGLGLNLDLNNWVSVPVKVELDFCNSELAVQNYIQSIYPDARVFSLQTSLVWTF